MLKAKRSQAALEFLMTYGWAILVVLIVISALAYFGVLNPQMLLPSRCSMPTGFGCQDYVVKETGTLITLAITNGMGQSVVVDTLTLTGQGAVPNCVVDATSTFDPSDPDANSLANGEQANVIFLCDDTGGETPARTLVGKSGSNQKYRWTINLEYHLSDSTVDFKKSLQGELFATVEE